MGRATAARTAGRPPDVRKRGLAALGLASRQRAHGIRRRALHSLSLSLARHPRLVACGRAALASRRERMARLALLRDLAVRLGVAVAAEASAAATLAERRRVGDGD